MFPFSLDVIMMPAYSFSVPKAFLKEYPVILILIPEVWTEEMKLFALHFSKIMIYSFLSFWLGSGSAFFCWSVRIPIRNIARNSELGHKNMSSSTFCLLQGISPADPTTFYKGSQQPNAITTDKVIWIKFPLFKLCFFFINFTNCLWINFTICVFF